MGLISDFENNRKPEKPDFGFISGLTESKLIPSTHNLRAWTARDIADFAFLYLLALEILRHEDPSFVTQYANATTRFGNFDMFMGQANDLYIFLHVLCGANSSSAKAALRNPETGLKFLERLYLDARGLRTFLRSMTAGQYDPGRSRQFFLNMENRLHIAETNYRSIRRLVVSWPTLDTKDKALVMTRLLQAFRTRLARSEIRAPLEKLARDKHLEIQNVLNPEKGQQAPETPKGPTKAQLLAMLAQGVEIPATWKQLKK